MFKKLVDLELSRNQQTIINITAAVLNMLVTTLISFVLSPYIVSTLGVEANGFVGLATQFINYISLVGTALNSMGGRFMMMAYYNDEHEKFRRYYSSLLFANLLMATVFGICSALCVLKLERLVVIPSGLLRDVKWLFATLFANFVLSTMMTVWSTAPFIKNRLYLNSITGTLSSVTRGVMILGLFMCLEPSVCFIGIATLCSGCVTYAIQILYKRILFPELRARLTDFSFSAILEIISSGIWNTVSSVGYLLTSNMDLVISNLFIDATAMGLLSLSHTLPSLINTLNETISGAFTPALIIDYAEKKTDSLVQTIKSSSKIISVICSLPLAFLVVYGVEFYNLWQPTVDAQILYNLSVIIVFGRVFFTGMQPLFSIFTVVNKVRLNAIVNILNGCASIAVMYLLLRFTNWGVYAIACASVACCFVKNLIFVIPFTAKYLGLKSSSFYSVLWPSLLCNGILVVWGSLLKNIYSPTDWLSLILSGLVFAGVGLFLNGIVVLNRAERKTLVTFVSGKIKRS